MEQRIIKITSLIARVCGTKILDCRVLGIPVMAIYKRDVWHYNIFFLCVPLLRITKEPKVRGVSLLLMTWLHKVIKYLLFKWSVERTPDNFCVKFCGTAIYRSVVLMPYKFGTASFRA